MRVPIYQVDAFAVRKFSGNPAAVMPLPAFLDDALLQAIALENNLSETAFLVSEGRDWQLRWFTPRTEVPLCGHGTLASAWVVTERLDPGCERVVFHTLSGPLTVQRRGDRFVMDFPTRSPAPVDPPAGLEAAVGRLDAGGLIVTAPGDQGYDCVSRYFAPAKGIAEDPVTGGAHCALAPFWGARLGKPEIRAYQASARGGAMTCRVRGDRVDLEGGCVFYMEGEAEV
jgi:predicted PhzF superfamily epimerase YddE/YHI9